jgi:hypothetical protein
MRAYCPGLRATSCETGWRRAGRDTSIVINSPAFLGPYSLVVSFSNGFNVAGKIWQHAINGLGRPCGFQSAAWRRNG